jgi:DNA-binding CsgD family transcriptional regulator
VVFTRRQCEILERAAGGLSDKEIARDLGLSTHTVRSHLQRLYQTQRLANRAEAVAAYVEGRESRDDAPLDDTPLDDAAPSEVPQPRPLRGSPEWRVALFGGLMGAALVVFTIAAWAGPPRATAALSSAASEHLSSPSAAPSTPSPAATPVRNATPARAATQKPLGVVTPSPVTAPPLAAATRSVPAAPIEVVPATSQLSLINQERAAAALPPVTWNECLGRVASGEAQRLAEQGYLSKAAGTTAAAGCRAGLVPAESLAYWTGISDSQVNQVLTANPVDRAVLLGPYHNAGAYWAVSSGGVAFLALEFA